VDLELTAEQRLLAETINDVLTKRYRPSDRLDLLQSDQGWSREMWRCYADLGLLGLTFEERYGGAGMGIAELSVVTESFGRALVLEPYLSTVILGGGLIAAVGSPELKASVLPRVAAGEMLLAFAHTELDTRWSLTDIQTSAAPDGGGWRISGQKISVLGGDSADAVIVTGRTPGGPIGLFLISGSAVRRNVYQMQDGLRGADLLFEDAPAAKLGPPSGALSAVESVLDVATAALCAEAVGVMESALWMTVDYLKSRKQFGRPLADLQALQHRAADMYVSLEQARSMALLARLAVEIDDMRRRRTAIQAAKIHIDLAGRHITQQAVQLHGAIGLTMEYPVGHYFRRMSVITKTFADVDTLVESVGSAGGLISVAPY
jgi:alkylation response protein AidB-like acyl-CoA dehydrogenase